MADGPEDDPFADVRLSSEAQRLMYDLDNECRAFRMTGDALTLVVPCRAGYKPKTRGRVSSVTLAEVVRHRLVHRLGYGLTPLGAQYCERFLRAKKG